LVTPGEIINKTVEVTNTSDAPKTLYPYFRDFVADGELGVPRLVNIGSEEGLGGWIQLGQDQIDFKPQEKKTVSFNIKVPDNASPGGHYGAILFGTKPPDLRLESEDKGAAIATAQQVACLLLFQVAGDIKEDARIREFKTDRSWYSSPFVIGFNIRIENLGNVHIKPRGTVRITDMFGKEINNIRINDQSSNVLPSSIRRFEEKWEGKRGFGLYKASLGLTYGNAVSKGGIGMQSMFSEVTFWILPWGTIIPVVLGLIFFISLFWFLLKLYKNKAVKKAMAQMGYGNVRHRRKIKGYSPTAHLTLIISIILIMVFLLGVIMYFLFFA
jgi:hypothetical protein